MDRMMASALDRKLWYGEDGVAADLRCEDCPMGYKHTGKALDAKDNRILELEARVKELEALLERAMSTEAHEEAMRLHNVDAENTTLLEANGVLKAEVETLKKSKEELELKVHWNNRRAGR